MNGNSQSPFANLTPVIKNILIINVIFFLAYLLFDHSDPRGPVTTLFGAFYFNSPSFRPWQIITYMFMHGGFEHILFNMFALFSIGPLVEYYIGSKRFFNLYFVCGIGGVFLQLVVQAIQVHNLTGAFTIGSPNEDSSYFLAAGAHAQQLFDIYHTPLVGASGAVVGVMIAFRMLFPEMELMVMFIPIPIKAKYLVLFYIGLEIFFAFKGFGGDNVAHFAHLGGALFGFILVKAWGVKGPEAF